MVNKRNKQEYELFSKLSDEWWDENGKFRVLHQIRPIRIQYILDQFNNQNIKNLDILDLGCGGGLVSESLSRLGANVTGLDFVEKNIEIAKIHSSKKCPNDGIQFDPLSGRIVIYFRPSYKSPMDWLIQN